MPVIMAVNCYDRDSFLLGSKKGELTMMNGTKLNEEL